MRPLSSTAYGCLELTAGWEVARSEPGAHVDAGDLDGLDWRPARVPGTVAAALPGISNQELDGNDWWFRVPLPAGAGHRSLELGGIATLSEVFLDGERVLASESMFVAHEIQLNDRCRNGGELAICCRALTPALRERRRPRARWHSQLVAEGNLRWFRTMLLGRAPGFAAGPAAVGPWRPVRVWERSGFAVQELALTPRVGDDGTGTLAVRAAVRPLPGSGAVREVKVVAGRGDERFSASLGLVPGDVVLASGEVSIPDVAHWWPHTHGEPALYDVTLEISGSGGESLTLDAGRTGFRELEPGRNPERDGLALSLNGVSVFARGAVWTPLDLARPHSEGQRLAETLERVVAAGMNILRIPGTACYESDEFYARCDELGILVWQDFMFANLDYPESDAEFMASVTRETRELLGRLAGRPSPVVLCGGSEVAQQVAMLGLEPALANGPLYRELLPGLIAQAGLDVAYLPSSPCGGELPFRPDRGIAHYYGVGAYRRALYDVRRAEVRFAGECLAFANVPDEAALAAIEAPGGLVVHHPAYKAGVPRDAGTGWDFEDVRDHYLKLLYGQDAVQLRSVDHARYLELSRFVTGEAMAEVFGEWRREASPCRGGLVLWMGDLLPGSGWGLLDHRGEPKVAYHLLRQALAPVAVWSTDEGLGGIAAHVANDSPEPLRARLRASLYRDQELKVGEGEVTLELAAHDSRSFDVEELLGRFLDASWAYRFGPPAHDLVVLSLEGARLLSQAFRRPAGRAPRAETAAQLGVRAELVSGPLARVSSRRFLWGARISVDGFEPARDAFSLEPGAVYKVPLVGEASVDFPRSATLTAVNLVGRVPLHAG